MGDIDVVFALLLMAIVVLAAIGAGAIRHHRRAATQTEAPFLPRSLVRVLTSDEELREAVTRAARFEQMVADTLKTRTRRYESMISTARITDITRGRGLPVDLPDDSTSRSA